jgi:hypothetical protein
VKTKALTARRLVPALALASLCLGLCAPARGQLTDSEERLKILTDPESVKKKVDKDKTGPPLELFRSQIAPFDVLPYVKANHWSTLSLELRSKFADYEGSIQTAPVMMLGLPQEIVFRRDARLPKVQRTRLSQQVMLPRIPKDGLNLELIQRDAIRADEIWQASLRTLEPHQMLIMFLTKEPNDAYASWNRFQALYPHWFDRSDLQAMDRARYYRLVLPLDPDKPPLSSHPLTWTTISHVVWDGMPPDNLNPSQQQAMLDWLHWGGQLILVGGAGPSLSILKDSFLSPYLPAEVTGESTLLTRDDLSPVSATYPPPVVTTTRDDDENGPTVYSAQPVRRLSDRYRAPAPIIPKPDRPVFLATLKPKEGAVGIPLGDSGSRLLGVEQRVGRGRILMLAFTPTDPAIASWPGLDTFVRRVILRRPEESRASRANWTGRGMAAPKYGPLPGPDLSWVRYFSRDMGVLLRRDPQSKSKVAQVPGSVSVSVKPDHAAPDDEFEMEDLEYRPPDYAVAEWIDSAALPRMSVGLLEEASGIKVPSAMFVLKVVLAYILALVPLNWLICRYLLRRRELAWVAVPIMAFGFAIAVERAAAYDMGYNSACDEVNLVEAYGGYTRGHVSRFASLYTTGRTRYTISYPNDPTALALPLDTGRSLRGEDIVTSLWQSYPVPALEGFLVQPRSLGMFRAEQMVSLDGAVSLVSDGEVRKIVNEGSIELRDAVLVDVAGPKDRRETFLGTIAPGASVEVKEAPRSRTGATDADALRPQRFLKEFRRHFEDRPENQGELRLVAWTPHPLGGQKIEPPVDRHRGFTAMVIHLKSGPPPAPEGPVYNSLASGKEEPPAVEVTPARAGGLQPGVMLNPPGRARQPASKGGRPRTGGIQP